MSHLLLLVQEMLSSVRETQQGQDFLETQAAADQLQLQLTQSLQRSEEAVADELAKDEAYRQAPFSDYLVVHASYVSCKSVVLAGLHDHAATGLCDTKPAPSCCSLQSIKLT